ncbi:MAG: hypothetical protein MUD12_08965 [Spirochaetes bacterium]|nr:hypothetical protein [Spirochaetota bacterium]
MRRILIISLILFIGIPGYSIYIKKNEAAKMINDAEKAVKDINENTELNQYIPHDVYTEALLYLMNSKSILERIDKNSAYTDYKEYLEAYYYGNISLLKTETAKIFAQAKQLRYKKLLITKGCNLKDIENYSGNLVDNLKTEIKDEKKPEPKPVDKKEPVPEKKVPDKEVIVKPKKIDLKEYNSIISANLIKKGPIYKIELYDKNIFRKSNFKLNDYGVGALNKIVKVLIEYPECKIKIVGHSRDFDYKNYSKYKAKVVSGYLLKNKIDSQRISYMGIGNKEVMDTHLGFRRVDRVEIIVSGINQ